MDDVGIIAEVRLNGKPHKPPETVMLFGEMTFSNVLHRLDESLDDENGVEVRLYSNANKIGNGTVAHLHDPASTFAKLGLHFVVFQVTAEQPDAPAPPADDIGNDTMAMLMSGGGGGTRFNKRHRPARHAEDTAEKRADRKIENEIIDMLAVDNMGTQLLTQVPDLKRFIVELQKALLAITDHHSCFVVPERFGKFTNRLKFTHQKGRQLNVDNIQDRVLALKSRMAEPFQLRSEWKAFMKDVQVMVASMER
jgi:hypothetical protein